VPHLPAVSNNTGTTVSFKDRIAAFNKGSEPPLAPKALPKPQSFVRKPFIPPPPSKEAYIPSPKPAKPQQLTRDPPSSERIPSVGNRRLQDEATSVPEISKETLKERILAIQKGLDYPSKSGAPAQRIPEYRSEEKESQREDESQEPEHLSSPSLERFRTSSPEPQPSRLPESRTENDEVRSLSSGHEQGDESEEGATNQESSEEQGFADVDPEVARRQALRERMAKMSGGLGMHMAFGRSPGIAIQATRSHTKPVYTPPSPPSQPQNPIPVIPGLPPVRMPEIERISEKEEELSEDEESDEKDLGEKDVLQSTGSLLESPGSNKHPNAEVPFTENQRNTPLSDDEIGAVAETSRSILSRNALENSDDESELPRPASQSSSPAQAFPGSSETSESENEELRASIDERRENVSTSNIDTHTGSQTSVISVSASGPHESSNLRLDRPQLPPPPPPPPQEQRHLRTVPTTGPPIPQARFFDIQDDSHEISESAYDDVPLDKFKVTSGYIHPSPSQIVSSSSSRPPPPPPPSQPPLSPPRRVLYSPPPIPSMSPVYTPAPPNRSSTLPLPPPPPPPPPSAAAPLPESSYSHDIYSAGPGSPSQSYSSSPTPTTLRRAMTERTSLDIPESRTSIDRTRVEEMYIAMKDENIQDGSRWWLEADSPPPIYKGRDDLAVEVEDNHSTRRGGRSTLTREVYVLFSDYSQKMITVQYDVDDPSRPVFSQRHKPPPPEPSKSELESWHKQLGLQILSSAESRIGGSVGEGTSLAFVKDIIKNITACLPSPGTQTHGAVVYSNIGNSSTKQSDEIRPGDIVAFRHAIFQTHGGLRGKTALEVGKPDHVAIVQEWNGSKRKLKVIEQRPEQRRVVHNSYKIPELKSGEVHVFRPMPRSWIDW